MRRREFVTMLGVAVSLPVTAPAQHGRKVPTIGFLGAASAAAWSQEAAAFRQRLRELGWIEGQTVTIDFRWAEGHNELSREIAAEFVRLNVDVIVTGGSAPVLAAKQVTSVIPIVFAMVIDPVGAGLVASLARPGGNVTGLSLQSSDLAGKRVEILREVVPRLHKLAILGNANNPGAVLEMAQVEAAARTIDVDFVRLEIRRVEDISAAIGGIDGGAEALYVSVDPLINANRNQINALALRARLPTMHGFRVYVEGGGLISYGASPPDMFRRTAEFVDKILRGAQPADIPVEQPTRFDLVINIRTAKALGLEIPATLLARADEVIE